MHEYLDTKRILVFIAFAFGIAWAGGLAIYLTGGLVNSPPLAGPGSLTLAFLILATVYMGAPALAHIFTRLLTREGWHGVFLRPRLSRTWRTWLICWFGPGVLTIVGLVIYFLFFPQHYDPTLGVLRNLIETKTGGQAYAQINPWILIVSQGVQALLLAPVLNAIPVFGEEFGWRAYLLPKLMPLGTRKALLVSGVIWGLWHAPVIAMGHNYGLAYPGFPWAGVLMMVWFCVVLGALLGWASQRAGSVWPAVIGHGAINGIAAIGVFFVQGQPNPLLGPMPVGIIGSIGFTVVAVVILLKKEAGRGNQELGIGD